MVCNTGNPNDRSGCVSVSSEKCQTDADCNEDQMCVENVNGKKCKSVCVSIRCGPQAICVSQNHAGQCQCKSDLPLPLIHSKIIS